MLLGVREDIAESLARCSERVANTVNLSLLIRGGVARWEIEEGIIEVAQRSTILKRSRRFFAFRGWLDRTPSRRNLRSSACTWGRKAQRVRLIRHRVFQPSPDEPLDFENAIEGTLLDLKKRFRLRKVLFDPWQMQAVARRLAAHAAVLSPTEFTYDSSYSWVIGVDTSGGKAA